MKMKEYAILKRENHPGKVITKNEEDLIKMYEIIKSIVISR